jgi:ankyrin repeat protein
VRLLERADIEVNLKDNEGKTALFRTAERGHEGIVRLLLARREIKVNL